jgi:hypothetical protein
MFNKKCSKCRNKISGNYDFCPFCGNNLKSSNNPEDYGLIGRNDFLDESFFPKSNSMMDKIFDNAFRMAEKILEKQMKSMTEEMQNSRTRINEENPGNVDIQFFVNGKRVFPNSISKNTKTLKKIHPIKIENKISEERMIEASKLPRKEAVSRMKRIGNKIIYEVEVPGVDNIDNVMINQLETSIEIKALTKNKVYHKTLNLNLPILSYGLNDGNLVLELQGR